MDENLSNKAFAGINIMISETTDDIEWDDYLEKNEFGQYEQSSKWAKVKAIYGWQPVRIIISIDGKIIGGVQILKKSVPFLGSIGYITKGPVFSDYKKELFVSLIDLLKAELKKYRIKYLILQPPDKGHVVEPWLKEHGFQNEQLVGVITVTTMLDLSRGESEIFQGMYKNNHRNIKHGYRKGIKVREGSANEIPLFYELMSQTCKRRGVKPNPPDSGFFIEFWKNFAPRGNAKLFFAEYENDIISGFFVIPYGDTLHAYKFGWTGQHGKLNPNHVLYWEIIKWAKAHGYHYFNFVGIDKQSAETVLKGNPLSGVVNGASFFKLMFGGKVYKYPSAYYYIYNPFLRFAYSNLFLKIVRSTLKIKISSSPFNSIVSKYFGRMGFKRMFISGKIGKQEKGEDSRSL